MADAPESDDPYIKQQNNLRGIAKEGMASVPGWKAVDRNMPDSATLAKIANEAKAAAGKGAGKAADMPKSAAPPSKMPTSGGADGVTIVPGKTASWKGDGGYAYTIDVPTGDITIDASPDGRFDGKVVAYDGEMGGKAWQAIMAEAQRRGVIDQMFGPKAKAGSGGGGGPLAQMTPEV